MRLIFLFLYFWLTSLYCFSQIITSLETLSADEKSEINVLCDQIKDQLHFKLVVNVDRQVKTINLGNTTARQRIMILNVSLADSSVKISALPYYHGVFEEYEQACINILFKQDKNSKTLAENLKSCIQHIAEQELNQKLSEDNKATRKTEKDQGYSLHAWRIAKVILLITVIFMVQFTIKSLRKGNNVENTEFTGFARLTTLQSLLLFFGIFACLIYYTFSHFQGIDIFIILFCGIFGAYPMMVYLAAFIFFIKDIIILQSTKRSTEELSAGAKLLLIAGNIPTDYLLEANFLELLMRRAIRVEIKTSENTYNTSQFYTVYIHKSGKPKNLSYWPYLKSEEDETPYQLYVKQLYKRIGKFKAYRKDYLYQELLSHGLITNLGWLTNQLLLTDKGNEYVSGLMRDIKAQENLAKNISDELEINSSVRINSNLLLSKYKENLIYKLRAQAYKLHADVRFEMLIDPFLNENFDFRIFRQHLFRASAYKFEWRKTSDSDSFY